MTEPQIRRLEDQLRRAFEGEAWHGPSLMELLADVSAEDAAARPIANAHTIWELVLHITGTYGLVLRRLRGNHAPLTPEQDFPPQPKAPTAQEWLVTLNDLRSAHQDLRRAVAQFDITKLDQPLGPQAPYPAYTQFIGVTQHDLYHAGQIALLKKMVRGKT